MRRLRPCGLGITRSRRLNYVHRNGREHVTRDEFNKESSARSKVYNKREFVRRVDTKLGRRTFAVDNRLGISQREILRAHGRGSAWIPEAAPGVHEIVGGNRMAIAPIGSDGFRRRFPAPQESLR